MVKQLATDLSLLCLGLTLKLARLNTHKGVGFPTCLASRGC